MNPEILCGEAWGPGPPITDSRVYGDSAAPKMLLTAALDVSTTSATSFSLSCAALPVIVIPALKEQHTSAMRNHDWRARSHPEEPIAFTHSHLRLRATTHTQCIFAQAGL